MQKFYALFAWATMALLVLLAQANAAWAETTTAFTRNLDIYVDRDICNQGPVICSDSGSVGPADSTNNSVVEVIVHAKMGNGTPVGGLAESDFSVLTVTAPPPGSPIVFVGTAVCASCFVEVQTGVYRLAARTSAGNWGTGTYVMLVEVSVGPNATRQVVAHIDIAN